MGPEMFEKVREYVARNPPQRISEAGTIEAAVAIILTAGDSADPEVLLIKRAENEGDPWSGQIALPGGRRDPGDLSLLDTACREAREETAADLAPDDLLGELDDLHPRTPVLPPVVVRPFVFGLKQKWAVEISSEATLHLWVSLNSLRAGATTSTVEVRGTDSRVPSYVVDGHVVWGMTERILRPIIQLAG